MKNKRMLALLLVITLVSMPMQQVYAESMSDVIISAEEKLDDDQQMSSDEVENSGDADNIGELIIIRKLSILI